MAAAAIAAALIGVFVFGLRGSGAQHESGIIGPTGTLGPGFTLSIKQPLPGGTQVSLGDAAAALGRPIVLPDSGDVTPSTVGAVWANTPHLGPTGTGSAVVAVTFPTAGVWVNYQTGEVSYGDDVLLDYQAEARDDSSTFQVVDLNGVPALAAAQGPDQTITNGSVRFDAGGVTVTVFGRSDQTTLQAIARTIIDRSDAPPDGQLGRVGGVQLFQYLPPARKLDLADASKTLGAPLVLPDTPLVRASDAGPVWSERTCPAKVPPPAGGSLLACWIWVSFPSARLSIGYLRPPMYRGTQGEWALQARNYGDNAKVIELGSVPALAIEPRDPYPGSVEFDLGGTRVVVAGGYDTATLQAVAQSIVDRSS